MLPLTHVRLFWAEQVRKRNRRFGISETQNPNPINGTKFDPELGSTLHIAALLPYCKYGRDIALHFTCRSRLARTPTKTRENRYYSTDY
jgi:hypothetical protein